MIPSITEPPLPGGEDPRLPGATTGNPAEAPTPTAGLSMTASPTLAGEAPFGAAPITAPATPPASDTAPPAGAPGATTLILPVTPEDRRIARLATAAIFLSLVDAAIPTPLPGIKPGLANIVTLLVLQRHGWRATAWVTGLRVLAGSLLLGQFLAPGFFLSAAGALFSLGALGLARALPRRWFGPVSLSILAAFAHISGQLLLARLWLIPHNGIFLLAPVFALAALFFGTINGLIAARLLAEDSPLPGLTQASPAPASPPLRP